MVKQRGILENREQQLKTLEDRGLAGIRNDYYKQLKQQVATQSEALKQAEDAARAEAPEVFVVTRWRLLNEISVRKRSICG